MKKIIISAVAAAVTAGTLLAAPPALAEPRDGPFPGPFQFPDDFPYLKGDPTYEPGRGEPRGPRGPWGPLVLPGPGLEPERLGPGRLPPAWHCHPGGGIAPQNSCRRRPRTGHRIGPANDRAAT